MFGISFSSCARNLLSSAFREISTNMTTSLRHTRDMNVVEQKLTTKLQLHLHFLHNHINAMEQGPTLRLRNSALWICLGIWVCIEEWQGFLVNFSVVSVSQETKHEISFQNLGGSGQTLEQNSGRIFKRFGELSFCNFSDPIRILPTHTFLRTPPPNAGPEITKSEKKISRCPPALRSPKILHRVQKKCKTSQKGRFRVFSTLFLTFGHRGCKAVRRLFFASFGIWGPKGLSQIDCPKRSIPHLLEITSLEQPQMTKITTQIQNDGFRGVASLS